MLVNEYELEFCVRKFERCKIFPKVISGGTSDTLSSSPIPLNSFEAFRKKKEKERSSRFKPKKGPGSSKAAKKAKVSNEVKVQVGLVCDDGNGQLKKLKGRTIPVLFNENDDAKTLLQKSIDKHTRYYQQFDKDDIYIILYQDMTLVKNLPGSNTPFTLGVWCMRSTIYSGHTPKSFFGCVLWNILKFVDATMMTKMKMMI